MLPYWARAGLSFLIWFSPLVSLGIFFPLGVIFAFPKEYDLRRKSLAVIFITSILWVLIFLYSMLDVFLPEVSNQLSTAIFDPDIYDTVVLSIFLFGIALLFINFIHSVLRNGRRIQRKVSRKKSIGTQDSQLGWLFYSVLSSFVFVILFIVLSDSIRQKGAMVTKLSIPFLYGTCINYFISLAASSFTLNKKKSLSILAFAFVNWEKGHRLKERWKFCYLQSLPFSESNQKEITKRALAREKLLPGFGQIFLGDYWRGFPLLFLYLLLIFFTLIWILSYLSPAYGIQFLGFFGLKPGIPDKDFFLASQNIEYAIISFVGALGIYLFSQNLLKRSFTQPKYRFTIFGTSDKDETFAFGIRKGFQNVLPISLLIHFILLSIFFIIPISIQRASQKKKSDSANRHFQPDKMEYYFIDPDIPDSTKGLNGGVVTGNEEVIQESGEKISNEKLADNGPKSGYIKKIKGKKLPPTYSNYISAKMRVPESYMDYWASAPQPYSSVVAYTITQDGEIVDVQMVEGSRYPDQDLKTLQLIERLGPVMPPPGTTGDVRVTELFWNGPIDPNFVPTPLQKEMINLFDGRFMEELEE